MAVVSPLQLVFDNDDVAGGEICADQVEGETPDGLFSPRQLEIHAERLRKDICIVEQPGREVIRFVAPNFANIDWRQAPKIMRHGNSLPESKDCRDQTGVPPPLPKLPAVPPAPW